MIEAIVFRKATEDDVSSATNILRQAVDRMLAEGKQQWDLHYPNESHVKADVTSGTGYVLESGHQVVAYGAVVFDGEPAYKGIDGKWLSDNEYVVVHRLAVLATKQRSGLAKSFLSAVEQLALNRGVRSFRIDTNFDNIRMLALLEKCGFTYCGEIMYDKGSRKAFEKIVFN